MKWLSRLFLVLVATSVLNKIAFASGIKQRPRVIVTTDGEYDDQCSMIRFLLYANEFDIQGLVYSSSKHHWKGTQDTPGYKWLGTEWLEQQLNAYANVFPNLRRHDPDFPSPDELKSQIFVGNILLEGDMKEPTPGSDHIVEILMSSDPSPVWLLAWGGPNTIARALKTIEENYPERMDDVSEKVRLYLISEQDSTYRNYIAKQWPQAQTLICNSSTYGAIAYRWYNYQTEEQQSYFDKDWITRNILENHGPLCKMYKAKNGRFRSEGDSPSFLHLIDVGLGNLNHPEYGGWGGRFIKSGNQWRSSQDKGDRSSLSRWLIAFQNDFAARADWCVADKYDKANHAPTAVLNGDRSNKTITLTARSGGRVALSAQGSCDPDGDTIETSWVVYPEAGTFTENASLNPTNGDKTNLTISPVENSTSRSGILHVILTVRDSGTPMLVAYRRAVILIQSH